MRSAVFRGCHDQTHTNSPHAKLFDARLLQKRHSGDRQTRARRQKQFAHGNIGARATNPLTGASLNTDRERRPEPIDASSIDHAIAPIG